MGEARVPHLRRPRLPTSRTFQLDAPTPGPARATTRLPGAVTERRRSIAWLVPFAGLAAGLLLLWWLIDVPTALQALTEADPRWVGLAALLALNATALVGAKLWAVVRIVDQPRTLGETWSAVMAGLALNAVIPGRGGDLVRAVFLARDRETVPVLLGAVLVERLADLFALGLLVLVVAPRADLITAVALCVVFGAAGATLLLARLGPRVPFRPTLGERVARTAVQVRHRPGYAALALVLSLATWLNNALALVVTLRAVGSTAPFLETLRSAALGILAGVVPVSVSGIGTRDTVLVLALQPWGEGERVAAGSLLYTVLMYWFLALIGSLALGRESLATLRRSLDNEEPGP